MPPMMRLAPRGVGPVDSGTATTAGEVGAVLAGERLPGLHSSLFAPDRERTLRTGAATLTAAALEVLGKPQKQN